MVILFLELLCLKVRISNYLPIEYIKIVKKIIIGANEFVNHTRNTENQNLMGFRQCRSISF